MRRLAHLLLACAVSVVRAPATAQDVEARTRRSRAASSRTCSTRASWRTTRSRTRRTSSRTAEGRLASLEEDISAAREQRKALPDMRVKVNHIVAEGDLVSIYWTASGTNTAAGWGIPATGKSVSASGMTLFRFERGLIKEEWSVFNQYSIHQAARPAADARLRSARRSVTSAGPIAVHDRAGPAAALRSRARPAPFTTTTSKPSANLNGST